MDGQDLKTFETVARTGGMGRAAQELGTVQSNVTARIRRLEEELGVALFVRESRGVRLTEAGQRLMPYAGRIARLFAEAARAARDDGAPQGPLAIGTMESTAALRLSPVLNRFVATYPRVDLVLRTGTSAELVRQVVEGTLDGAFVCGPVNHPALEATPFFREELALLTPPDVAGLSHLASRPHLKGVVLRAGCAYRQRLDEVLARHGVVGLRYLEFGTLEALLACVAAGLGITLLPRAVVGPLVAEGRIAAHPLPSGEGRVDTLFARRRDAAPSSALDAFLATARPVLAAPALAAAE